MILGISGGRKGGNSDLAVKAALEECKKEGLETEFINLKDTDLNLALEKLEDSDGIIIGSPVYFGNISSNLAMLFEHTLPLRRQDFKLRNKIGGALAVGGSRNGGQEFVIASIHRWMLIHDMIVVGDAKPTSHFGGVLMGRDPEDVSKDEVGLKTVKNLGKKVAETVLLTGKK